MIIVLTVNPNNGELNIVCEGSLPGAQPITPPAVRGALVKAVETLDAQAPPEPVSPFVAPAPRKSGVREVIVPAGQLDAELREL